jgi:Putative porin
LRAEQRRIAELQQQIEMRLRALETETGSQHATAATARTTLSSGPLFSGADANTPIEPRLIVSGDMRVRSQRDYAPTTHENLSAQVRGRLGATFAASDVVTVGARLVTGDSDDPNSTDVQLSNFDDDLQVSLDQAYLQLNFGDVKIYGGKIPQPFMRTELVWDGDVNPQGASIVYKHALASGAAFRASGLFFIVDESALAPDSTMTGVQLGYDSRVHGEWKYDVSVAYFDYTLGRLAGGDAGDYRSNPLNPDGTYISDFKLGDLIVGATWTGAGDRWPVRLVADYVHNFGAAGHADTGYGADLSIGRASGQYDWRVTYGYWVAETDAVLAAFSNDNIALATNYRLHALTFDYVPFPRAMLSAIWYRYKRHDAPPPEIGSDWMERVRLALTFSF